MFVELMLQSFPAPILSPTWKVQKAERLKQLVQERGDGNSIAAAKEILFGAFLTYLLGLRVEFGMSDWFMDMRQVRRT